MNKQFFGESAFSQQICRCLTIYLAIIVQVEP